MIDTNDIQYNLELFKKVSEKIRDWVDMGIKCLSALHPKHLVELLQIAFSDLLENDHDSACDIILTDHVKEGVANSECIDSLIFDVIQKRYSERFELIFEHFNELQKNSIYGE